jgi:hypothetical protein
MNLHDLNRSVGATSHSSVAAVSLANSPNEDQRAAGFCQAEAFSQRREKKNHE